LPRRQLLPQSLLLDQLMLGMVQQLERASWDLVLEQS
jgi:hypothetical protein